MPISPTRRRRFASLSLGAASVAVGLSLPAPAFASQSYVVSLHTPPEGVTCHQTIADVSAQYSITPAFTYTSASCGFSANLSKKTVDSLRLDTRVKSVTADGALTGSTA